MNDGSPGPDGTNEACGVPWRRALPIAMTAGVSRCLIDSSTLGMSAPGRSILFTNSSVGMARRCSVRISTRV